MPLIQEKYSGFLCSHNHSVWADINMKNISKRTIKYSCRTVENFAPIQGLMTQRNKANFLFTIKILSCVGTGSWERKSSIISWLFSSTLVSKIKSNNKTNTVERNIYGRGCSERDKGWLKLKKECWFSVLERCWNALDYFIWVN